MLLQYIKTFFPHLRYELRVAHMPYTSEEYLKRVIMKVTVYTLGLTLLLAMLAQKQGWPLYVVPIGFVVIGVFGFWLGMKGPKIKAHQRAVDIDREVLFAGRFLLIKLHSGKPLVNALMEASRSYGVAHKYFEEIVRDIEVGTPLEEAIERAMIYTPSESFRKVLFQIHNALRLGIDVTQSLEAVLDEITENQMLAIARYGKKLSSVTLFYMLLAVVFPSLGMTILTVIIGFTDITMNMTSYIIVVFFLAIIQFMFITMFKSIRPKVNI